MYSPQSDACESKVRCLVTAESEKKGGDRLSVSRDFDSGGEKSSEGRVLRFLVCSEKNPSVVCVPLKGVSVNLLPLRP